jgi:branched-chain amino acid transport system substrate-binding protein
MVDDIKRKLNRRNLIKASGVAGITAFAGCISTSDDDSGDGDGGEGSDGSDSGGDESGPYSIGMVDSLTGSLSAFGERNQRGKDLALGRVNELGINGQDLDIIVEDSGSENQGGISAAQKLVNQDSVPFLIGAVGSGVSIAIYESVIQETDVVQLSQNSTGLNLTDFPGLLRMSPTGRAQSLALANIIADDGYDSVALTYVNNDFGQSLTDAFVDAWDGEIAYNSAHDQEQSSYSSVMSEMNNSGADAWLFITYQAEFTTMVNEAFSSGYEAQFYGADSAQGSGVLEGTPEGSMEGMKITLPSAPIEQENYQAFASAFEEEYGQEPTSWAAYAYDCVINAALAIQAADEFTGAALQETVREVSRPSGEQVSTFEDAHAILADGGGASDVDYQGVSGPIDFDENGDPVGFLQVVTVEDHEYVDAGFIEG